MPIDVHVNLKKEVDDSYPIQIGEGVFSALKPSIASVFIIDRNVYELHQESMPKDRFFLFDADEKSKTFENIVRMLEFMKSHKCIRSSEVIAIGGGITGDMTAFAASIYMRGIQCRQVPTTLLSMVDSSVGGKCGINFEGTKNFIGSFWQPASVTIDLNFLQTLTDEDYFSGLAEVLKMALTFDKPFVDYIITHQAEIIARDTAVLSYLIQRCCEIKADVVMKDERESGLRRLLNYGHTFAHAIETDSNHQIKHGHAVAIGMVLETLYAENAGLIDVGVTEQIQSIMAGFGYATSYQIKDFEKFINALQEDKKALTSGLVLSLTAPIGTGRIFEGIQMDDLTSFFQS